MVDDDDIHLKKSMYR